MATDTLTVQPPAKDTFLSQSSPTNNYGSQEYFYLEDLNSFTCRGILESSLATLRAAGLITILSATLSLKYWQWNINDPAGKTLLACKLTRTDWVEAQATWNIYKASSNWTSAGGDYVTSNPGAASAPVPGAFGWIDFDVLAIVQDAYNASADAEFLIKFQTEGLSSGHSQIAFRSKEYGTAADRPKLVIVYVQHPEPPTNVDATDGILGLK